ncbi:hypothetical protein ACP6L2_06495 [Sphingobacterium lactis]|uniref:SdpI/YhfL family protein n=1 Tax=Sphingobacterium kyonggiense TaxID=714075 RepID=A0ABP7YLU0_9SPHI
MEKVLAVFIPIAFFICVVLCVFFISKYRSETITKLGGPIPKLPSSPFPWKKLGIVIIGFGVGILISSLIFELQILPNSSWPGFIFTGITLLTVGGSMIIADGIKEKDQNQLNG